MAGKKSTSYRRRALLAQVAARQLAARSRRAMERAQEKKQTAFISAARAGAIGRRGNLRRPTPNAEPQVRLSVLLEGQAADIIAALASMEGDQVTRTAVARTIVEDELWKRYSKSETLRRHVAARIAGRVEAEKHRPELDDLYDPLR